MLVVVPRVFMKVEDLASNLGRNVKSLFQNELYLSSLANKEKECWPEIQDLSSLNGLFLTFRIT